MWTMPWLQLLLRGLGPTVISQFTHLFSQNPLDL